MNKGLIIVLAGVVLLAAGPRAGIAEIYKVVDKDGNVTYTDQEPEEGAAPMSLPDISIVDTEFPEETDFVLEEAEGSAQPEGKTPRELRRIYRDFRIIQPAEEESLWGTGNEVVVAWGASAAYEPGMSVSVIVDGEAHSAGAQGNLSLSLDRGEHKVHAVLHDQRGRRIVTTPTVTFYVKQASALINPS